MKLGLHELLGRLAGPSLIACLLAQAGCGREEAASPGPAAWPGRKGVAVVEQTEASFTPAAGQRLYVPAYSSIYTADRPHDFRLAVTLTIRNADPEKPLIVTAIRYHDQDGGLVRDHLPKPVRVGPLAALDVFVQESDTAGGLASSFLLDWIAATPVVDPVVECVMVGTTSGQGVSFVCPARIVTDRRRPGAE